MAEEVKQEKKTGVYLCSGCGIGAALDMEKLRKVAADEMKVPVVKVHEFLCGPEGIKLIKDDIASGAVNTVSVMACSIRAKQEVFDFGETTLLDRVDLRERVAWSHEPNHEDTQSLAGDYARMSLAKLKAIELPVPFLLENPSKTILVVGGGITGLTAALNAARAGYKVELVEKSGQLGGMMNGLKKVLPQRPPYSGLVDNFIADRIKEAEGEPNITVRLNTVIESIAGGPGMFDVTVRNGARSQFKAGAIVTATGFYPYDVSKLTHLGAGLPDVVSNVEFEKMAKENALRRPSDGKPAKRVVFIQCAGSRDKDHLPYCSSYCCAASLKQAWYVRQGDPDATATIIYRDMRTTGTSELFYKEMQQDPGVFMTKGEVESVAREGDALTITVGKTLLGERIAVKADLVVLAVGMVSGAYDASVGPEKKESDMQESDWEKVGKAPTLKLDYRQGPEAPALADGFPDSHFICFPYETRRTGIYTAGAMRHPQDTATAQADAAGAAMKAIQCVEMTARGEAVSPRARDTSYPEFALQRCTQCKRCTVECPFGAINEDEKLNPIPFPTRCRRCATCLGACPVQIISFRNYSIGMVGAMIKSIEMPDEFSGKRRALAFVCENDAMPAFDMAGINRLTYDASLRIIPLRCMGSLNLQWVADALSSGWDGIMMIGCRHGDDYQCHNIKGSELATTRASKVQETLDRLMLESERIQVESLQITDYHKLPDLVNGFMERINKLDPNPYKGF